MYTTHSKISWQVLQGKSSRFPPKYMSLSYQHQLMIVDNIATHAYPAGSMDVVNRSTIILHENLSEA